MKIYKIFFVLSLLVLVVHPMAAQEDTEGSFSVDVQGECNVYTSNFAPPGGDSFAVNNTDFTLNALAKNETGHFYFDLVNNGNLNSTATYEIDVRQMDNFYQDWENGTSIDLTKQNVSYQPNSTDLNITEDGLLGHSLKYFFKSFRASYPAGFYRARLQVNYSCYNSTYKNVSGEYRLAPIYEKEIAGSLGNHSYEKFRNFRILDAQGTGSGVEQDDYPSDDPYPSESNVTSENETTNYTAPQTGGNSTSELERPSNANRTGNYTTNTTVPADANRTGETSNQTVPQNVTEPGEEGPPLEGNNDNPGQTPEPEPEPEPTPGDSPDPGESNTPEIAIDIEPTNQTYTAYQGQYAPAELQVENVGDATVNDIELLPEIANIRPSWEVRSATVSNLSVNETVTRDVFVRPPQDQAIGEYLVPVRAENPNAQLDLDYFTMKVKRSEFDSRVSIAEAPRNVSLQTGTKRDLPVLVENPGRRNITNVTAYLQNAEDCGNVTASSPVSIMEVNETASLSVGIEAGDNAQSCDATLIVSSSDGAYAFSDIYINTIPDEGLIPKEQRVPFIAIAWTFVLAAYAVLRKRYELTSSLIKIPFFMLLMGETVIILYMLVNYYGVLSVSFLPF